MLSDVDEIVKTQLAGAVGAPVWHEQRAQETATSYVTYTTQTNEGTEGSAPVLALMVEVRCVAPTSAGASALAALARTALDGYSGVRNGARVLSLTATDSVREPPENGLWGVLQRFRGVAIV